MEWITATFVFDKHRTRFKSNESNMNENILLKTDEWKWP